MGTPRIEPFEDPAGEALPCAADELGQPDAADESDGSCEYGRAER